MLLDHCIIGDINCSVCVDISKRIIIVIIKINK